MLYESFEELASEIGKKMEEFFEECGNNPNYLILWYGYAPLIKNSDILEYQAIAEGHREFLWGMEIIWTKKHMVEVA